MKHSTTELYTIPFFKAIYTAPPADAETHFFDEIAILPYWDQVLNEAKNVLRILPNRIFIKQSPEYKDFTCISELPISDATDRVIAGDYRKICDEFSRRARTLDREKEGNAYAGEYSLNSGYKHVQVNLLEFWLFLIALTRHLRRCNKEFPSFQALIVQAIDVNEFPSNSGFIANPVFLLSQYVRNLFTEKEFLAAIEKFMPSRVREFQQLKLPEAPQPLLASHQRVEIKMRLELSQESDQVGDTRLFFEIHNPSLLAELHDILGNSLFESVIEGNQINILINKKSKNHEDHIHDPVDLYHRGFSVEEAIKYVPVLMERLREKAGGVLIFNLDPVDQYVDAVQRQATQISLIQMGNDREDYDGLMTAVGDGEDFVFDVQKFKGLLKEIQDEVKKEEPKVEAPVNRKQKSHFFQQHSGKIIVGAGIVVGGVLLAALIPTAAVALSIALGIAFGIAALALIIGVIIGIVKHVNDHKPLGYAAI